jgi:hypothetical protein
MKNTIKIPALSNAASQYVSSMGRSDTQGDSTKNLALTLIQLRWVDGDYDTGGAYWGGSRSEHIYRAYGYQEDETVELFIRAKSFSAAESLILADYPYATFVRVEEETTEKTFWFSGNYGIEIQLTMSQAQSMSHSGSCDADVASFRQVPSIWKQLDAIGPDDLRRELREYGFDALSDHDDNLDRILWLAACDIRESNENEDEEE